jgi:hypothetical protein
MTAEEQREWVRMLGDTKQEQVTELAKLMRHAMGDQMSVPDRVIVRTHLERLRHELGYRKC